MKRKIGLGVALIGTALLAVGGAGARRAESGGSCPACEKAYQFCQQNVWDKCTPICTLWCSGGPVDPNICFDACQPRCTAPGYAKCQAAYDACNARPCK
jgi:hypothetical protein